MKNILKIIIVIFAVTSVSIYQPLYALAEGVKVIRDSEIESVIDDVIEPLRKNSGIDDLKIVILEDNYPNAFTAGGNTIYVSSGLIIDHPDADVLRGVIAHEIGHIQGKHIIRRQEVIDNYTKASLMATALGLASIASGGAIGWFVIALGDTRMGELSILAYSRGYESSADQYALNLLEKSGHNVLGLIKFFQKQRLQTAHIVVNPYEMTHPMTKDRIAIIKDFNKKSKYPTSQNSKDLNYRFRRSSAKLAAYTLESNKIPEYSFAENAEEINHYIKAIQLYRKGKLNDALKHVDSVLQFRPKDPFYHELKGQISFETKNSTALKEYNLAIKERPNDVLLRLGRAVVGITKHINDKEIMEKYYQDLQFVVAKEPQNILALYYLARYFDEKNMVGQNYLTTAQIALYTGNIENARRMAKAALAELKEKSPDWYKANDLLEMTQAE